MIDLKDLTYAELEQFLLEEGEPKFRAKQVFSWLYKGVESLDEMTNLPKKTRERLSQKCFVSRLAIEEKYVSKIDGTVKYLFRL